VLAGGAAAQAGLVAGDIVVAVDGRPISSREELLDRVEEVGLGATRTLTVVRDPQNSADRSDFEVLVGAR
jgi:S1-C subfamily serine protease